ncbi:hypothetical protein EC991775_1810, partial [Escherichia coli 99.1775]
PLVDFTRDRLHRKTLRRFGRYEHDGGIQILQCSS